MLETNVQGEEIWDGSPIVVAVRQSVELRKLGSTYFGRCPFHEDKGLSLHVSPVRGTFHCVVCHAAGNGDDFQCRLAARPSDSGMSTGASEGSLAVPATQVHHTLTKVAVHFRKALRDASEAVGYLRRWGITGQTASYYRLGYCAGGHALSDALDAHELASIAPLGLGTPAVSDSICTFTAGCITWPIMDTNGHVIAVGATPTQDGAAVTWTTTRAWSAYSPSGTLYGLLEASEHIQKASYAVLTDGGCMSVLALHQCGIKNAVCPVEGPIARAHVEALLGVTDRILFLCPADRAGKCPQAPALRELAASVHKAQCRIAMLEDASTPAEYVKRSEGERLWQQVSRMRSLMPRHASNAHLAQVNS